MATYFLGDPDLCKAETVLKVADDGASLVVLLKCPVTSTWVEHDRVPLGEHRLFRPDRDCQYLSPGGRLWSPN